MEYKKPKIIFEAGCNHMGDFNLALELVDIAASCGADAVKFQKRCNKELLTEEQYNSPHPVPHNSYGDTYGAHREFLEFDKKQHKKLKKYCEKKGIIYSTSVWDVTSAKEIVNLKPDFIKVPSACNNNFSMLKVLRDDYRGDIHISLGMTTTAEKNNLLRFFNQKRNLRRIVLYSCTSGYPVPFEDVCLLEIEHLRKLHGDIVKDIGFSGHHLGIAVDIAAYTLGARWIERHATKNRAYKGTDHSASLEPAGFSKLVRDLNATHLSLKHKCKEILDIEQVQRDKLKYRRS